MTKSNDEIIDGPEAAAKILNAMPEDRRKRILSAIQKKEPAIFKKITANLFSLEDIPTLTENSLQLLVKEIDHEDLLLLLSGATKPVQFALLKNMSRRKASIVLEDLKSLPQPHQRDISGAQTRILATIDVLRTKGLIRSISLQ